MAPFNAWAGGGGGSAGGSGPGGGPVGGPAGLAADATLSPSVLAASMFAFVAVLILRGSLKNMNLGHSLFGGLASMLGERWRVAAEMSAVAATSALTLFASTKLGFSWFSLEGLAIPLIVLLAVALKRISLSNKAFAVLAGLAFASLLASMPLVTFVLATLALALALHAGNAPRTWTVAILACVMLVVPFRGAVDLGLATAVAQGTAFAFQTAGIAIVADGTTLLGASLPIYVTSACAGVFTILAPLLCGCLAFGAMRNPKAQGSRDLHLALLFALFGTSMNALRVAVITWVAHVGSPQEAIDAHAALGVLTALVTYLPLLVFWAYWQSRQNLQGRQSRAPRVANSPSLHGAS